MEKEGLEQPKPLVIEVKINSEVDEILYNRIHEIPEGKRIEHVLSWMRIGELVSTMIIAGTSDTAIENYFRPVLGKIEELKTTIDAMKGDFTKSQSLGRIGEEMLKGQFNSYFNREGDTFFIVSDEGHQADIHATIQVKRPDGGRNAIPVLIEAKLYSHSVPTSEVDKFWNDLSGKTNFNAGMFVSLTSDISEMRGPISIDVRNGKLGIFIANKGTDQVLHIVAWALLREMLRVQIEKDVPLTGYKKFDIERIANLVKNRLEDLRKQLNKIDEIERASQQLMPLISKTVGQINNSSGQLREGIEMSLESFHRDFTREVAEMVTGEKPLLPCWNPDIWTELTSTADDKHKSILELIRIQLSNLNEKFTLYKDEDNILVGSLNSKKVFTATWISNKVRISFAPIENVNFSDYLTGKNKHKLDKNKWLTIEGTAKKGDLGDFDTELCQKLLNMIA